MRSSVPGLFPVLHDICRGPPGLQLLHHELHGFGDMGEKELVAFAEVIETRFTVRRYGKPVFRAFTMAGKQEPALPAVCRQAFLFIPAEL